LSSYCPVCNGLQSLSTKCSECQTSSLDFGRFNDYLGPYSPYRPIEDISMTNGFPDIEEHSCMHMMCCPNCNSSFIVGVKEWGAGTEE
jgi:hypothetical protein